MSFKLNDQKPVVFLLPLVLPAASVWADVTATGSVTNSPPVGGGSFPSTQVVVGDADASSPSLLGTMQIDGGTGLVLDRLIIGDETSYIGNVLVTGAGTVLDLDSSFVSNPALQVGHEGTGYLTVNQQATVTVSNSNGNLVIGRDATSAGFVHVDGLLTQLTFGEDLIVGSAGYGELRLTDGALMYALDSPGSTATIGAAAGGVGLVEVDGARTLWQLPQTVSIGVVGTGTLHISNGATVDGNDGDAPGITVGSQGTIELTNGGRLLTDLLTVNGRLAGDGLVTGPVSVGVGGEIGAVIGQSLQFTGALTNAGQIEAIGTEFTPADMRFDALVTNTASTGVILSRNAAMRFNGGLTNNGALAVSFGTSDMFGDITNNAAGSIVLSGGSNTTFYDDITNNGNIIVAASGPVSSTAVFFGAVSGSGSITGGGSVFLHGDLRPGNSPAAVNHDVNLFLMSTATTQIELGGTTPGNAPGNHDQINNLKSTTLGGTLDIQLINGFDPEQGDTFDIFNLASSTGTFADFLLPLLDSGLGWHLGKLYTDGELHVELEGDLNLDGFVGVEDLDLLLANWGNSALAFDYAAGDASGDGLVGSADLALVQANWGAGTPGGGNIPEPGSLALLALGGLTLLRRRR